MKEICNVRQMFFKEGVIHAVYRDTTDNSLSITSSTDHGINWESIKSNILVSGIISFEVAKDGEYIASITSYNQALNSKKGLPEESETATLYKKIIRSTDNGLIWKEVMTSRNLSFLHKSFKNKNSLYAIGADGVELTKNAGSTWDNRSKELIYSAVLTSEDNIFAINKKKLLYSADTGKSWKELYQFDATKTGRLMNLFINEELNLLYIATTHGHIRIELGKQKSSR